MSKRTGQAVGAVGPGALVLKQGAAGSPGGLVKAASWVGPEHLHFLPFLNGGDAPGLGTTLEETLLRGGTHAGS